MFFREHSHPQMRTSVLWGHKWKKEPQFGDCSCGPSGRNSSLDADGNHRGDKKCLGSKIYFEVRANGIFWWIRCGMWEIEEPKMTLNFWSGQLRQWQFCSPKLKILGIRDRNRDRQPNRSGVDYSKTEILLRHPSVNIEKQFRQIDR